MVNRSGFTDFDDLIVLLSIAIDLLIVFLLRIMNWNFPGLAIIWLSLNHFNAIFRSDWRFSITSFTDLAQLYMVLSSAKLQISVFSTNHNISFKKILKSNGPRIEPCGTPRRIFNHELKVESSLTLCVRLEKSSCKNLRLFMSTPFHQCFVEVHKDCTEYSRVIKATVPYVNQI